MPEAVKIGQYSIGPGQPCFIIAEAGVNHNGDMSLALRLIDAAAEAGAQAVKFQSFITEELITLEAPKAGYQVETTGIKGSQYPMLKALELNASQHAALKAHCESAGILYLCTPYETISVDMLDELGVAAYKIASTDTTNIPLLSYIAGKGRPALLSTGMSSLGEVEEAVQALKAGGLEGKLVLLQCTSEYPAPVEEVNLRAMHTMQQAFNCPVGFSDHTPGTRVSSWAVALGASAIEKHFTLDRRLPGPDHRASLEPQELVELVHTIRQVESALGDGVKRPTPSEIPNKSRMQKSLVARRPIAAGQVIEAADLACKRPGTGLPPNFFHKLIGRRALKSLSVDEIIPLFAVDWEA